MVSALNVTPLGGEEGEELSGKRGPAYLQWFLSDVIKTQLPSFQISLKTHHKPYHKFSVHKSSST